MKKFLKRSIITLTSLALILYVGIYVGHKVIFKYPNSEVATISPIIKNNYKLNAASRSQPKNMEEYIRVLSNQVKNYNAHIDEFWPNNPQKNQYLIAKELNEHIAYLISPKGDVKKLSDKEFKSYGISALKLDGQWAPFKKDSISGAYVTVSLDSLNNYYRFQKYYHLGTYDQFLSYSHELFHMITQERWASNNFGNTDRDDREGDLDARRYRMLIQQQLAQAISDKQNREEHTKDALATYISYKENCKEDYEASLLYDRLEGTAFYYEVVSALYAGYPSQIKSQSDVYGAIEIIFDDDNPAYRSTGVSAESYNVGGYAGFLLDLLAIKNNENPINWKEKIEKDGKSTPMLILGEKYNINDLPSVKKLPTEKEYNKWISEKETIEPKATTRETVFDVLYSYLY